jgi:hypothetical protein
MMFCDLEMLYSMAQCAFGAFQCEIPAFWCVFKFFGPTQVPMTAVGPIGSLKYPNLCKMKTN